MKASLWKGAQPLVLASASRTRRELLEAAGIPCVAHPASVDERAIEARAGAMAASDIALLLAQAKAQEVAARMPERLVLGADQTLSCEGRQFHKPVDAAAAREQLMQLRGRTHTLHSAIAITRGEAVLLRHCSEAHLTMRRFSEDALRDYLGVAGASACQSVGAYQLEGVGIHLFERIEGDHFTILGLPLIPLLDFLRNEGLLLS
jgi:septum formation protein